MILRDRYEIRILLLRLVRKGQKKENVEVTKVVYFCNL
jgi:predicted transcriptional regulator